ncbi:MAG TPA: class I SAM-dependent methyltransferase [Chitinophagales bacterium]|nr:class I SAM-dependent methyltransferase [Chitinophagales bacterium]
MFEFHTDKERYFRMQHDNALKYVIPFIEKISPLKNDFHVLEIGCGEGGVLKAFLDRGCNGVGVELSESRTELAKKFLADYLTAGKVRLFAKDIYDPSFEQLFEYVFDLIVLKDVIEHIPDQENIIPQLKYYLKEGGKIFFGFPPWYMPFGGHQQICKSKFLASLPYYHLLPAPLYKMVLKIFGENEITIADLMDVKKTGISIERFEKIIRNSGLKVEKKNFYFINPIYSYKFGWKPRTQSKIISSIPYVRDFFTTAVFYLVSEK